MSAQSTEKPGSMLRICLTGNAGSGKSTVARIWEKERGAVIIDADLLARRAVKTGGAVLKNLVARFGEGILLDDGSLDRRKMGRLAFSDPQSLAALNALVHPEIVRLIEKALKREKKHRTPVAVLDAALVFEFGIARWFDYVVVVDAPEKLRKERLLASGKMDRETVDNLMRCQLPAEELASRADYVIRNSHSAENLRKQSLEVFDLIVSTRSRG